MNYGFSDFIGNIGVALILLAYLLLQLQKLDAHDARYSLMNGFGAAFVLVSLYSDFNLSAAVIQVFWLVISGVGLYRARER